MKVIVPVGSNSRRERTAVSFSVDGVASPSVTAVGLGVVVIVGLAGLTTTCSAVALLSLAALLLVSPL